MIKEKLLSNIFGFIGNIFKPVAKIFQTDAETRKIKVEGQREIEKAKIGLQVATLNARAESESTKSKNDMSYDMQVLRNRSTSWADEVIIIAFVMLVVAHFIPGMQPTMTAGWKAMGYESPPWWLEFVIVGICVSTLGLMGVLRVFANSASNKIKGTGQCVDKKTEMMGS